jgi:hypothetical protein
MGRREHQVLLGVWCSPQTKERFRLLFVRSGFKTYEQLLEWLIGKAEAEWMAEGAYAS